MLSNIFLTSALIVAAILFSMFGYNYYYDVAQAKQIQKSYDTITEIKKILAQQYNKNPDEITRDEIIAVLPKGRNWDKLFLSNQNSSSNITDNAIIDENVNFVISKEDKLILLALESRLKNIRNIQNSTENTITYTVSSEDKNRLNSVDIIKKEVKKVKGILSFSLKTLDEILSDENYTSQQKTQIKEYLKKELENSKNSLDLMIYNNIKVDL